ncbi:MAG TPA: DUF481 domain-containing protein [Cellvibrio sp.]|nr:DUF481 domain-containing protein [Cellvibrio sp.]
MSRAMLALIVAFMSGSVLAEEKKPWDVELDLGVIATSGNTETTSVHAKLGAKQHLEKWTNEYILSSLFKNDEVTQDDNTKKKEKTAEKYLASAKSAYQLSEAEKSYLFGFVSYTHDQFGSYKTYTTAAIGYGDWIYSTETLTWFAEAGPGYFRGEKVIVTDDVDNPYIYETEQGALLRLATELEWKFSQTAVFKQVVSVETGSDNTRTLSETSVAASITNAMQMKFAVAVAADSKVAPGKEKVDTTTSATLVYKF